MCCGVGNRVIIGKSCGLALSDPMLRQILRSARTTTVVPSLQKPWSILVTTEYN
ncbi:Uncharacterised protein [Mycobacteroides abscessus subsp. abscessus]|nr:Uncharacterised protein [Mycobacteroides abscessus subsp. abscessus]SKS15298.1 Uncharacterised protein [Mycobacteroides abscessus subsp. abscessus]